jgi:hypothetical protein
MSDEDLKAIIALYQQKTFELYNQNIVLEVQVNSLTKKLNSVLEENEKNKSKRATKTSTEDFA